MQTYFYLLFGQLFAATYLQPVPKHESRHAIFGKATLHATKAPITPQGANYSPKDTVFVLGGGWGVLKGIKLDSKQCGSTF